MGVLVTVGVYVGDAVGVNVGVAVGVKLAVGEGVKVGVRIGAAVGTTDTVDVGECEGVLVGEGVSVALVDPKQAVPVNANTAAVLKPINAFLRLFTALKEVHHVSLAW